MVTWCRRFGGTQRRYSALSLFTSCGQFRQPMASRDCLGYVFLLVYASTRRPHSLRQPPLQKLTPNPLCLSQHNNPGDLSRMYGERDAGDSGHRIPGTAFVLTILHASRTTSHVMAPKEERSHLLTRQTRDYPRADFAFLSACHTAEPTDVGRPPPSA